MRRRSPPPYPDIETAQGFMSATLFRSRYPQLPATPDVGIADSQGGARQRQFLQDTPLGEPGIDVDVRSVYDVRPINAFDVHLSAESDEFSWGGTATPTVGEITMPVPLGYVFVCRLLNHYLFPEPPATSRGQCLLTLTKQGAAVPFNVNVPVGVESQDLFRAFVIYDEGETFGARMLVTLPSGSAAGTSVLGVDFYGNFLRKTGRSANQMIGNPVPGSRYRTDRG
jgi:hypothetical protein